MPWRPRIRFSLATLFIVVTAICMWLGTIADKKIKQRRGVERVEKLSGAVFFDFQRRAKKDEGFDHTAPPPGSEWARKWLGEDYCQTPVCVQLWDTRLTADDLRAIAALRDLEQLQFHRVDLSAVSCRPLATLKKLEVLVFDECALGETSLIPIARLARLRRLDLIGTPLDDRRMPPLSELVSLDFLCLTGTQISGSGFGDLKRLANFSMLIAGDTPFGDRGLEAIGTLPEAKYLQLEGTAITDHGLAHLAGMISLERLRLDRTAITDRGLAHLARLRSLEVLTLRGTHVRGDAAALECLRGLAALDYLSLDAAPGEEPEQTLARLRQALPNCQIDCQRREAQDD